MKKKHNQLSDKEKAVRQELIEWIRAEVENDFNQVEIVLDDTAMEAFIERCTSEVNVFMLRSVIRTRTTRICNKFIASHQGQVLYKDEILVVTLSAANDDNFYVRKKLEDN